MPYDLGRREDKWCVWHKVKKKILKCYYKKEDAVSYFRALYHAESGKEFTKKR